VSDVDVAEAKAADHQSIGLMVPESSANLNISLAAFENMPSMQETDGMPKSDRQQEPSELSRTAASRPH
jgi:hypothetical protein